VLAFNATAPRSRARHFEAVKNELTAAIAIAAAIVLATGWLLTWARLAAEHIPSESILGALPQSYFVQVALESIMTPLIVVLTVGAVWVPVCTVKHESWSKRLWVVLWVALGAVVSVSSFAAIAASGSPGLRSSSAYSSASIICNLGSGVFGALTAVIADALLEHSRSRGAEGTAWDRARPIVSMTLILCVGVISAVRVLDARFANDALPVAQVTVAPPCGATSGQQACLDGGFYLGENGAWVFLGEPRNPCPGRRSSPSRLLEIRKDTVRQLQLFDRSDVTCAKLYGPLDRHQ
jgi:hypothetical protein